tara:strand:- start:748 stop:1395 length:648 start_codon:yes stop_codon:yes gene_type:complete
MISWLSGEKIELWEQGNRVGILINCCGIGYEVTLLKKELESIKYQTKLILWIHQITRDDGNILYGFINKLERDLFRKLIGVSGIGSQIAISLLENNNSVNLISAVINEEIIELTKSPGIGKKTGERIILELKSKLNELVEKNGLNSQKSNIKATFFDEEISNEVRSALQNLKYEGSEIQEAFNTLSKAPKIKLQKNADFQTLLKEALMLLSQETS